MTSAQAAMFVVHCARRLDVCADIFPVADVVRARLQTVEDGRTDRNTHLFRVALTHAQWTLFRKARS